MSTTLKYDTDCDTSATIKSAPKYDTGLPKVKQHQLVYRALGDRMREEIHALSMQTLTPAQWSALGPAQ